MILSEYNDGDGGVADVVWDLKREAVVVDEDGVKVAVEEFRWHCAFELVESEVEEAEGGDAEDDARKTSGKAVVADVELVKEGETA